MSFSTLIDLVWILKMLVRPSRSGSENSTFLSRRPHQHLQDPCEVDECGE